MPASARAVAAVTQRLVVATVPASARRLHAVVSPEVHDTYVSTAGHQVPGGQRYSTDMVDVTSTPRWTEQLASPQGTDSAELRRHVCNVKYSTQVQVSEVL